MEYRKITNKERLILEKLAEANFKGRDQLVEQIQKVDAWTLDENGSVRLQVLSPAIIPVNQGVLVEARCPDLATKSESDPHVNILLHVKDGKISILEIYKDDGTTIKGDIDPNKFKVFSRYGTTG